MRSDTSESLSVINSALLNWGGGNKDMSLWTSSVISLLLLLPATQSQAQQTDDKSTPSVIKEAHERLEESPTPLIFTKKGWSLTQAYFDVFKILSDQNTCSSF